MISQILFNQSSYKLTMVLLLAISVSLVTNAMNNEAVNSTLLNEDSVYAVVEKMPQFPGGDSARIEFLKHSVHYPEEAQKNQEQGKVVVQFVVSNTGAIQKAKVVKKVSVSLDNEALRVVNSFPSWIPGEMNGQKVSVYQILQIPFKYLPPKAEQLEWDVNDKTVIVVDSLKMPSNFNLHVLQSDRVASIDILKPFPEEIKTKLIAQYGSLAENGVIVIKSKNITLNDIAFSDLDSLKIEEMPLFPGGENALFKFLCNNIKYPVVAQENEIQGKVVTQFMVDSIGKIRNLRIVQSVDPYLDKEALRVISTMPDWVPGKSNGKPVNVKYTLPMSFRLDAGTGSIKGINNSNFNGWERNEKTIVLLDGERLPKGFDLSLLSIDRLTSYLVHKPSNKIKTKKLIEIFGEDAQYGVIDIKSNRFIETYDSSDSLIRKASNGEECYNVVEVMPLFPGGDKALINYLSKNLKYPELIKEKRIQGSVICMFVVNSLGKVIDVEVARGLEESLNKEAIRVIQSMPDWIPGKQRGKNVAVKYTLPINFRFE